MYKKKIYTNFFFVKDIPIIAETPKKTIIAKHSNVVVLSLENCIAYKQRGSGEYVIVKIFYLQLSNRMTENLTTINIE